MRPKGHTKPMNAYRHSLKKRAIRDIRYETYRAHKTNEFLQAFIKKPAFRDIRNET